MAEVVNLIPRPMEEPAILAKTSKHCGWFTKDEAVARDYLHRGKAWALFKEGNRRASYLLFISKSGNLELQGKACKSIGPDELVDICPSIAVFLVKAMCTREAQIVPQSARAADWALQHLAIPLEEDVVRGAMTARQMRTAMEEMNRHQVPRRDIIHSFMARNDAGDTSEVTIYSDGNILATPMGGQGLTGWAVNHNAMRRTVDFRLDFGGDHINISIDEREYILSQDRNRRMRERANRVDRMTDIRDHALDSIRYVTESFHEARVAGIPDRSKDG